MALRLLGKRIVARPQQCRSLLIWHTRWPPGPVEKQLWLSEVKEWSKQKNRWEWHEFELKIQENTRKNSWLTSYFEHKDRQANVTFTKIDGRYIRLHKFDRGSQPDAHRTHSYNLLLRDFFSHSEPCKRIARSILTDMLVNGAIPDIVTFTILIRCFCKYRKYQFILDVVNTQLIALGVKADDSFYKSLINGVCLRFGPNVGYQLLNELRSSRGIQMPLSCYDAIVRHFCKKKSTMTSVLIDVLMDMKQQRLFPNNKIYNRLIKGQRYHRDEGFMKAAVIGRQMLTQGMKIGALSKIVVTKSIPDFIFYK